MARTPKAPLPSVPARRGRKPKQAEPLQLAAVTDDSAADAQATISKVASVTPDSAPTRNKPGRKPKQRAEIAMPALSDEEEQQPEMDLGQPDAAVEQAPAQVDEAMADMAGPASADADGFATSSDAGQGDVAPTASQDGSDQLRPAARWDKTADAVQFDWPAIEQTAAQVGPNQIMAKLLLAARAEGANSRWPLA